MTEGVKTFLLNMGMGKYCDIFSAKGFDLETDIPHLTQSDLAETLMVGCPEEREIILYSARRFKTSPEHFVYEWLRRNSLDHYFVSFIQSGLVNLESVSNLELPNEELYDELEIELPGHRKRLERAVLSLRQELQRRSVAEKPVTQGWWGKPRCLPQAKFDFLCVEGTLFARHEPGRRVKIDFMVDSGSDVSTVQEQNLESLNLELVGPVYSCGIHGGNYTNLYRAQLQVGSEVMTVEVIASNYDSLGSRIVRHFRHVIDGNRHIWLKGNYRDPIPAVLPLKIPSTVKPLENKPQVLSIQENKRSTDSLTSSKSSVLANQGKDNNISAQNAIPSLSSSQRSVADNLSPNPTANHNSSSDKRQPMPLANGDSSKIQAAQKSINIINMPNHVNSEGTPQNLLDQTITPNTAMNRPDVGNKRTRELSQEESSKGSDTISPKFMRLDQVANHSLPPLYQNSSSFSSSSSSSSQPSSSMPVPTPHQHVSQTPTHQQHSTLHIPSGKEDNPIHTLPNNNNLSLSNTGDDIDHMDADKIYAKYLSSSSSLQSSSLISSSNNSQTRDNSNAYYSSSLNSSKSSSKLGTHSRPSSGSCETMNNGTSHTDIIHIGGDNDDEDDDCVDDGGGGGVVHVVGKQDPSTASGAFGRNFIPGSNSNSVTISMLDLDEEDFD